MITWCKDEANVSQGGKVHLQEKKTRTASGRGGTILARISWAQPAATKSQKALGVSHDRHLLGGSTCAGQAESSATVASEFSQNRKGARRPSSSFFFSLSKHRSNSGPSAQSHPPQHRYASSTCRLFSTTNSRTSDRGKNPVVSCNSIGPIGQTVRFSVIVARASCRRLSPRVCLETTGASAIFRRQAELRGY